MSRKPVDGIIQRNLNSCKSTTYYKFYPDIYKRDSPLLNNYAIRGEQCSPLPILFCPATSRGQWASILWRSYLLRDGFGVVGRLGFRLLRMDCTGRKLADGRIDEETDTEKDERDA